MEGDDAGRRARRGRQAARQHRARGIGIEPRVQELVERGRVDATHRGGPVDQPLVRHLDGDAHTGRGGAFAGAGLQHPELAALHRELDVLHVAVVVLEAADDVDQLAVDLGHRLFHRRLGRAVGLLGGQRQRLRRADAGDDVLALRIDQEFAEYRVLAGRRVAREGDTGGAVVAHVAEHHGLHVDRGAPAFRNVVQAAVSDRAFVHPRAEHRADGALQLVANVLGEGLVGPSRDQVLEALDQRAPVVGFELGIERHAAAVLVRLDQVLEFVVRDAEHDVAVHLDEAAVAVVGEARVAALAGQALDGVVVEAEVEDGVHHAGHRGAAARTHRDQERLVGVAEARADDRLDAAERLGDLVVEVVRHGVVVGVIGGAHLGGDGEAGRHRQAEVRHLGQPRALAAQQLAHRRAALGRAVAETVHPLGHRVAIPRSWRSRRPGRASP